MSEEQRLLDDQRRPSSEYGGDSHYGATKVECGDNVDPVPVELQSSPRPIPTEQLNVAPCVKIFFTILAILVVMGVFVVPFNGNDSKSVGTIKDINRIGFHSIDHPLPRSDAWGTIRNSYPTGAFWTNLAIEYPTNQDSLAVAVYPYDVKRKPNGLGVSYSASRRFVRPSSIADMYMDDLVISAQIQPTATPHRHTSSGIGHNVGLAHVDRYDNVSVTLVFALNDRNEASSTSSEDGPHAEGVGKFRAHLVKGAPFVTTSWDICGGMRDQRGLRSEEQHQHVAPVITSAFVIQSIEKFELATEEGLPSSSSSDKFYSVHLDNYQQWLVYTHGFRGSLTLDESVNALMITGGDSKTGICDSSAAATSPPVIRVAALPLSDPAGAAAVLAAHARVYPVGADMRLHLPSGSEKGHDPAGVLQLDFRTHGGTSTADHEGADDELLMLALPHHVPLMKPRGGARFLGEGAYSSVFCIKGPLRPVVGKTWALQYDLTQPQWYYGASVSTSTSSSDLLEHPKVSALQIEEVRLISSSFELDFVEARAGLVASSPTTAHASLLNPYEFGKRAGKMARLLLIGDELREQYRLIARGHKDSAEWVEAAGRIESLQVEGHTCLRTALVPWLSIRGGDRIESSTGRDSPPDPGDELMYDRVYGGLVPRQGLLSFMADFGAGYYSDHHFHYGYFLMALAVLGKRDPGFLQEYGSAADMILRDICNIDQSVDGHEFPYVRHKDFFDGHSWASGGLLQQANGKGQESSSEAVNAYYGCYLYSEASGKSQYHSRVMQLLLAMEVQATGVYWHMKDDSVYEQLFSKNRMAGNIGATDVTATTWFGSAVEYVHGINIMPITPATELLFPDRAFAALQWDALLASSMDLVAQVGGADGDAVGKEEDVPIAACVSNMMCMAQNLKQGDCCPDADGTMLACCASMGSEKATPEWISLLFALHALSNRTAAWGEVRGLMDTEHTRVDGAAGEGLLGTGNSFSAVLLWVATRSVDPQPPNPHLLETNTVTMRPECWANFACAALGMPGNCCPIESPGPNGTTTYTYLDCCPLAGT